MRGRGALHPAAKGRLSCKIGGMTAQLRPHRLGIAPMTRRGVLLGTLALAAAPRAQAGGAVRLATYNAALSRRGPGLLLRDILSGSDPQVEAAADVVTAAAADVLLLTGIDWDHDLRALDAFAARLAERGLDYPHRFARRPNSGWQTGRDMVGDGRVGTADDAQGYGAFSGVKGMALLSRLPVEAAAARDFSQFLWRDLPGARLPQRDGRPYPSDAVFTQQRLSTTGHWDVPVQLPSGAWLHVLAWYATPPVFGGPEDRNRLRNHDETRFWTLLLDGALPMPPPAGPFALMGDANLDPNDGDGLHAAIRELIAHPSVQDPLPRSLGAGMAAPADREGDPALHTVQWDGPRQPGNLRVDYVLPAAALTVLDAGVLWPADPDPLAEAVVAASRHRLVWVDVADPGA